MMFCVRNLILVWSVCMSFSICRRILARETSHNSSVVGDPWPPDNHPVDIRVPPRLLLCGHCPSSTPVAIMAAADMSWHFAHHLLCPNTPISWLLICCHRLCRLLSPTHPPSCRTSSLWSLPIYLVWLLYLLIVPLSVVMVVLLFVSPPPIGSNGSVLVIIVAIVMPLYFLPDAQLPHVSITNWQAFGLIRIRSTLLWHVGM